MLIEYFNVILIVDVVLLVSLLIVISKETFSFYALDSVVLPSQ